MKSILFGALSLTLMMASCSNEDNTVNNGDGPVVPGIATRAHIRLTQGSSAKTRAPQGSEAPTNEEKAVTSARVFVFAEGALVTMQDLTKGDDGVFAATFATTTGEKQIFATANIPAARLASIEIGNTLTQVKGILLNIASMADLATDNNFWMTNVIDAPKVTIDKATEEEVKDGNKNNVTVEIGRACAKVNMELATNAVQTGGKLTAVNYRVRNNPKRMYTFPHFEGATADQLVTPYYNFAWTKEIPTDADNGTDMPMTATKVDKSSYFGNGDGVPTFIAEKVHSYMMENSNSLVIKGKATYLSIKGTWTPDATATFKKANGDPATFAELQATYYRIATIDGNNIITGYLDGIYVANPTVAAGQKAVTYTNGVCYYGLWIADNAIPQASRKYAVARNSYYYVTVNAVSGPGAATEDEVVPDPEAPVEEDSYMKATIDIIDWKVIDQSGGI